MTVEQVASYLQLNKLTVYKFIRAGDLPAVRLGRSFRVRRADVDQFLEAYKVAPKRATRPAAAAAIRRPNVPPREPPPGQSREPANAAESAWSAARREERRRLREAMISSNPLEWVIRGLH
jgi:excisionase family DNA binding protein